MAGVLGSTLALIAIMWETANEYRKLGVSYLTVSIDAYIFLLGGVAPMVARLRAS